MIVNCGSICIDLDTGQKVDGDSKKAVPLSSNTVFRKIKPLMKHKKKIGQLWIASPQISLEYLMAIYMVKNEKKKIAGFFSISDNRYAVMEFTYTPSPAGISTSFNTIRETPALYMEIEDRSYDLIFGNTDVSNIQINFDRLLKGVMMDFDTRGLIILLAGMIIILGSVFAMYRMLKPHENIQKTPQAQHPPALTGEEKTLLHQLVVREMLGKYNMAVSGTGSDIAMSSVTFTVQQGDQSVRGTISIKYISYYPFSGATIVQSGDRNTYEWSENIVVEKGRNNIIKINYEDPLRCLKTAINDGWTVVSRKDSVWHMRLVTEDYGEFVKKINRIINCNCTVENINMSSQEYQCNLVLNST